MSLAASSKAGPYVIDNVLYGADEMVAEFVRQRVAPNGRRLDKYIALGVVRNGALLGGVVYHNYRGHDIEVTVAFDSRFWATPAVLKVLFGYPFGQLDCVRATAITGRKNKRARAFLLHLGCKLEGMIRKGYDGRQDAAVYGLLKTECRFL